MKRSNQQSIMEHTTGSSRLSNRETMLAKSMLCMEVAGMLAEFERRYQVNISNLEYHSFRKQDSEGFSEVTGFINFNIKNY